MDDDFNFGASIWASNTPPTSESLASSSSKPAFSAFPTEAEDAFEDGNFEFSTPLQASTFAGADDGFDDFGDFGDVVEGDAIETFDQESTTSDGDAFAPAGRTTDWNALCLDPLPSSSSLKQGIGDLMEPFWDTREASQFLRDENIRQVGGLNQVLVTPESRQLYKELLQSPLPELQPPNWTRSRIRRRHLVSLGIPVNLDEALGPHANGKPLPALQISTRPLSAPPGPRALGRMTSPPPSQSTGSRTVSRPGSRPSSRPTSQSRSATPKPSPLARASTYAQLGLGPRPEIDEAEINRFLEMDQDSLTLLPLPTLQSHLAHIRSLTSDTSALLAHLLQQRDALQQDSDTYNKLIAELVGEAQKMKTGAKTRTGRGRTSSGMA